MLVSAIKAQNKNPSRVLLTKQKNVMDSVLDDIHFYRIVEINRNREVSTAWGPPLSDDLLKRLPFISSLQSLDLGEVRLSQEVVDGLSLLKNLKILRLDETNVDDKLLAKFHLREVKRLDLRKTKIKGKLPKMPKLEILNISESSATDTVLDSELMPELKSIDVSKTKVTRKGILNCLNFKNLKLIVLDKKWKNDKQIFDGTQRNIEFRFVSQ